jgi:hypothetical protein
VIEKRQKGQGMNTWDCLLWIGVAIGALSLGIFDSKRIYMKHNHATNAAIEKIRAAHREIQDFQLNLSHIHDLKQRHVEWREEVNKNLEADEKNEASIFFHWNETKNKILKNAALKKKEIEKVLNIELKSLRLLQEWKATREAISKTKSEVELLRSKISKRKGENDMRTTTIPSIIVATLLAFFAFFVIFFAIVVQRQKKATLGGREV